MKRILKRAMAVALTAIMLLTAAPLSGFVGLDLPNLADLFTIKADAATYSGKCGSNLTWSLDTDTGVLTISGTGDMYNWDYPEVVPWYSNRSSIKTVVIGDSVTRIGDDAFYYCTGLTSVTIPDSVTSISGSAFNYCESLTRITIPDSVTSIGGLAFYGCTGLTSITVKEGNPKYSSDEYGVLFNKDKTFLIQYPIGNTRTSYTIPDSVTSIGWGAFYYCTGLTSVTIPDSVTSIGNYAFNYCTGLTSVTIGNSVKRIGDWAFGNCKSLTDVYYTGSEEEWNKIHFVLNNKPLLKANIHYNSILVKTLCNYQIKVVDDTTLMPIGGATVTFNGASSMTSVNGITSFSTTASTSSNDAVTISKNGYAKQTVRMYELDPYAQNTIYLSSESNPVSMALADIYLNGDEIKGPTVSILGKTFPLFSFNGSLNIPLSDITKLNVSTENDTKNKTVKYILGVKPGYSLDTDAKRNEDYKNFKDFYKLAVGGSNQQAYDKYNSLRSKLKDGSGSLGFSCGIQFAGYLEFSYATGNMVLKEGGITVTAEASVSTDVPFAGICYATFKIGGEIQGKLNISQTSSGVLGASASIGLNVKPTIAAGIKIIMKDLASIEAGIDGKINGTVKIPASSFKDSFSAYLSAQCYVKAKALWIFEHKWSTNFPKLELYPNFGLTSNSEGEITLGSNENIVTIDDSDFELIDRSYLGVSLCSVTDSDDLNNSSVYPYGYPHLIKLDDGRVVAMFIYDDGSKSDINRTTLYYSIYDNSTWSKPTPVNNSGLADFPAKVCTDGENVYALWLRASEILQDSYTTDDIVDKTELVYSSFNGAEWSEPVTVDMAGKYQMLYSIAENNGKTAIAWAENSDNNYTLNEGTTTLYTKTLENGEWSNEQAVTSAEGIASAAVGFFGNEVNVMYSVDNDGDLTTSGDSELYLNGTKLTDNNVDEGEVTFQNNSFYWIQGTQLICYDGITTSSTGLDVEGDYRVLTNGSTTAVTYLASDGFKNELLVSYFNSGSYTTPVALTSYDRHIGYYDALLNDDGSVSLLADIDNLSGDAEAYPYTTTDMVCDIISAKTDLEISDVRYDCAPTIGGEVNFTGTVTNTGMTVVDSYSLSFKNSSGATLRTETVYEEIQPGESKDFSVSYTVPSGFTKTTVTAQVNAESDCVSANNAEAFTIGKADIEIIGAQISDGGVITATVINNGFDTAENVRVKVSALGDTDTTLTTLNVGTLNAGETKEITYTVGSSYLDFTSYYVVNKFKLEASTSTQEESNGNNDAEVIYAPTPVESISLNTSTLKLEHGDSAQLVATVYPSDAYDKSVHWISDSIDVATVDDNGNITTVGAGTAIITAITDDGGLVSQCEVKTIGVKAISTTNIDFDSALITGLAANLTSLDGYIELSDSSCELKYDSLGTNSIVYLTRNDEIVDAYKVVIFGDVNGDGWYDGQDAITVSCLANGMLTREQVGEAVWMAADCNHDGVIDQLDVDLLNQAGVLLSSVDQTKPTEELLETSAEYNEYLGLIDQMGSEDTTETPTQDESDSFFTRIIAFIESIINFINTIFTKIF